jgi:hypothetical protein
LDGGEPPLQLGQGEPGHGTQFRVASNPPALTIKSEVNSIVRHPVVEVIIPGNVVPVKVPRIGESVFGPL